jgi:antitoxin HicB
MTIKYPVNVRPLSPSEGGGFLAEFPDFPGCMADGETVEEALKEVEDALKAWIASAKADGIPIPTPNSHKSFSGQFRLRIPKSLHEKLAATAKEEEVSLNTIATTLLAEGLIKRHSSHAPIKRNN